MIQNKINSANMSLSIQESVYIKTSALTHSYACYHTLSAYLLFHVISSYNLTMHYFRDSYAFINNKF